VEICGDNPADAGASHVSIDVLPAVVRDQFDTGPRLRIVDDGCSMSATQLHHAVSHGFTTRKQGRYGMVRTRRRRASGDAPGSLGSTPHPAGRARCRAAQRRPPASTVPLWP
jgi:hypothetical protein